MTNRSSVLGLAIVMGAVCASHAHAGDSAQRRSIDSRSRSGLVGKGATKLVRRNNTNQPSAVAEALLSTLPGGFARGMQQTTPDGGLRILADDGAYIEVSKDGSAGQYYASRRLKGIEVGSRLSDDDLSKRAVDIVREQLAKSVGIAEAELYPILVRHQIHTSVERATGASTQQLVSSEVVLGRNLDGVPVVGPGSKIFVELSTDGQLLTYRFDWSQFSIQAEERPVAALQTVLSRAMKFTGAKRPDVAEFKRFECGYYDQCSGRGAAELQVACLTQRVAKDADGHITEAVEEYVPAGNAVATDAAWPLSGMVNGQRGPAAPEVPPAGPAKP